MGFHICQYCNCKASTRYPCTSSGDVVLEFDNGNMWEMPDMILHYVHDHGWVPPQTFINDVMHQQLTGGERMQTKSVSFPTSIGYLKGPDLETIEPGQVPEGFAERLEALMKQADEMGQRTQYRSFDQ